MSIYLSLWLTKTWFVQGDSNSQLDMGEGIPPTHSKTTLGEWKANMGTWENWVAATLSRSKIRATLWVGVGRQIGGEWEKNTTGRMRRGERFIKSLKKEPPYSLLINCWHYRLDTGIWQGSAFGMHTTGTYPVHHKHCRPSSHKTSPRPSLGLFQLENPP